MISDFAQKWLSSFAGPVLAVAVLVPGTAVAQNRLSEKDQATYAKAVELENSIAEFLAKPDAAWFDSKAERIDLMIDQLADHLKTIAKTPDAYQNLSPCDHAQASIEFAVAFARTEFWIARDPQRAKQVLTGDAMLTYAESIRRCELLAGIRNRAAQSSVIGKKVRCLEMGVDCDQ